MRIIVCGSRDWHDRAAIARVLAELPNPATLTILSGGARGADTIAYEEAQKLGLAVERYPARWAEQGKPAGVIRNQKMLATGVDLVISFQKDSRSKGTADMVRRAVKAGVPVQEEGYRSLSTHVGTVGEHTPTARSEP